MAAIKRYTYNSKLATIEEDPTGEFVRLVDIRPVITALKDFTESKFSGRDTQGRMIYRISAELDDRITEVIQPFREGGY